MDKSTIVEILNSDLVLALVPVILAWLNMYVSKENRVQIDRAAKIAVHYVEQMRKNGKLTDEELSDAALQAAKDTLPMAVRLMVKDEALVAAIESTVGLMNVKLDQKQ